MKSFHTFKWAIIVCSLVALGGCANHPFSGAASMRVEVEVYKGPLSEEPEIQWGSLLGHLDEAKTALAETSKLVRVFLANQGYEFEGVTSKWPLGRIRQNEQLESELKIVAGQLQNFSTLTTEQKSTLESQVNRLVPQIAKDKGYINLCEQLDPTDSGSFACVLLVSLDEDLQALLLEMENLEQAYGEFFPKPNIPHSASFSKDKAIPFLIHLSQFGQHMRDKAFRWAIGSTGGLPPDFRVRIAIVSLIVANSEFGNQIKTRADALAKQLVSEGLDRRELPPSIALREAEATDFINLYQWFNATIPDFVSDWYIGVGTVEDRVKVVERLFSDHFWSKINTVYASGRGKVSMALIKDDVGNWNLKSFDNDPEELLKAYKDFTVEMIKKAAELAASAAAGGGPEVAKQIPKMLNMANQTAFTGPNSGSAKQAQGILTGLREDLVVKLKRKKAELDSLGEFQAKTTDAHLQEVEKLLSDHGRLVDLVAKSAKP